MVAVDHVAVGLRLLQDGRTLLHKGRRSTCLLLRNNNVDRTSVHLGTHRTDLTAAVHYKLLAGAGREEAFLLVRALGADHHALGSIDYGATWCRYVLNLNQSRGVRCHYQTGGKQDLLADDIVRLRDDLPILKKNLLLLLLWWLRIFIGYDCKTRNSLA